MSWTLPKNPFVGLRPFETEESLLFFGRHEQTRELLQQLYKTRFLAVVGSSGCGKSSLIRAGLIPRLLGGFLVEERDVWLVATLKPGEAPLLHLTEAILAHTDQTKEKACGLLLDGPLQDKGLTDFLECLEPLLKKRDANLLILVDQFEEIFRFSRTPEQHEEAAQFVAIMLGLAEQKELPIYVTMTMRSDYLGDCDTFQGLPEAMNQSQYLVPRLTRQQRREAIEGPVHLYKGEISDPLTDRLLNETGQARDDLPILQHALMRTWDHARNNGNEDCTLDLADYKAVGTVECALSQHADEALQEMDKRTRSLTKQLFQALTEVDPSNRRIRRPAKLSEIQAITGAGWEEIWPIIQKFRSEGRSFLIVSSENPEDNPLIDISHESLIRQWESLNEWVDEEVESAEVYHNLAERAMRHKAGRAGLWRDPELKEGLEWREKQQPNSAWAERYHTELETALNFLEESRVARDEELAAEEARRQHELDRLREDEERSQRDLKRARNWLIALIALSFLAVGAAGIAIYQFRQAVQAQDELRDTNAELAGAKDDLEDTNKDLEDTNKDLEEALKEAHARQYLAQANEVYASNPLLGIRLALEGLAIMPDEKKKDILEDIVQWIGWGRIANIHTDTASLTPHSDNSALFVTEVDEGLSAIWHANRLEQLAQLADPVEKVIFNGDGTRFVVDYTNAPGELRRTEDGEVIATLISADQHLAIHKSIKNVFFSPRANSNSFVVNYEDGTAEIWDCSTGKRLTTLSDEVSKVTFSRPDESVVIVNYHDLNIPSELRRTADGSLIETLANEVVFVDFSPNNMLFVIEYNDENHNKGLRRTDDGRVLLDDRDNIKNITFSPEGKFYFVDYRNPNTPDELRQTADSKVISELPLEKRDTENSNESSQTADDSGTSELQDEDFLVTFSPDETLFVIDYLDSKISDELGQMKDSSTISETEKLKGEVTGVTFRKESTFFFIEYFNRPGELRSTTEGENINEVKNVTFSSSNTLFVIEYTDEIKELRRTDDGSVLITGIENVTYGPNDLLYLVDFREPNAPNELHRVADGSVLASGVSRVNFSPQGTFFVVQYEESDRVFELHRTADNELLKEFSDIELSEVTFSSDEAAFVVYYEDGSAEVFQTANGKSVAKFTDHVRTVKFDPQEEQNLLMLTSRKVQSFPVFGQAGEEINIKLMNDNLTSNAHISVYLNGPDRDLIEENQLSREAKILKFLLPYSGNYEILTYTNDSNSYTLSIDHASTTASGETRAFEPIPSTTLAFIVHYSNGLAEVWSIPGGEQLATLEDIAYMTFIPYKEEGIFVVKRDPGSYEVHRLTDGRLVPLSGDVSGITFSHQDEPSAFVVRYADGKVELRNTTDGELIKLLTSSTSERDAVVLNYPAKPSFFGLRYADAPTEIYSSSNGEKLADLHGDAHTLFCAPQESADTCIVAYSQYSKTKLPGEVRRVSDWSLQETLTDSVLNVTFSPNPNGELFIIDYDNAPSEVRRTTDGMLLTEMPGVATKVTFSPDKNAQIFIADFAKKPSQVFQTSDGSLLEDLADQVLEITFNPFPEAQVFIIRYAEAPGEVRQIVDGALLERLADRVLDTIFSTDKDATSFVVTYADKPAELRRSADGELLAQLSGEVLGINFSPDPEATFFSVQYANKPSEVRRTEDGELLAILNGESVDLVIDSSATGTSTEENALSDLEQVPDATVEFSQSANAPLFVVRYAEGQTEVRRTDDGTVVTPFAEVDDRDGLVSNVLFSPEGSAEVFVVQYLSGRYEFRCISECEGISDGEVILAGDVIPLPERDPNIELNEGGQTAVLVVNYNEAPTEIRLLSDASLITTVITKTIERVLVDSLAPSILFVDYVDAPGEMFDLAKGEMLEPLTAEIGKIIFDQDLPDVFIIEYLQDKEVHAELRSKADGELLQELPHPVVERITLSSDKENFIVWYDDKSAQVFRKDSAEPLASLPATVSDVIFDIGTNETIQTNSTIEGYISGPRGETKSFEGEAGDIINITMNIASLDLEEGLSAYLELIDSNGKVLRKEAGTRNDGNIIISGYKLPYSGSYIVAARSDCCGGSYTLSFDTFALEEDDGARQLRKATSFAVRYTDGRAELWSIPEKEKMREFLDVENVTFSDDPGNTYAIFELTSGLLEIRRTSDGQGFGETATKIIFSPDKNATYFIVTYDNQPAEIYQTATSAELDSWAEIYQTATGKELDSDIVMEVEFSNFDDGTIYLFVKYKGDQSRVWRIRNGSLEFITDLRSNIADDFFDVHNKRLVVRYEDGKVYIINLEMPEIFHDFWSADDLLEKSCVYLFHPGTYDEVELKRYMEEDDWPVACLEKPVMWWRATSGNND